MTDMEPGPRAMRLVCPAGECDWALDVPAPDVQVILGGDCWWVSVTGWEPREIQDALAKHLHACEHVQRLVGLGQLRYAPDADDRR